MSNEEKFPIALRPEAPSPNTPFAGDLFGRRKLAERLTDMVERMADGCVLAIDAPWGEGKTWFGLNWSASLRSKGFKTAYIDAFRQDYVEDPFLMVCSEVLAEIGGDPAKSKLAEAGRKVAKALLPAAAKAALNLGGRIILGTADLSEDLKAAAEEVDKGLADALEKGLSKRLEAHAEDRRSVEGFAAVLADVASGLEKPLVVFVDELDRCRPDFAVKTVERIKHFFDVPNVVFVLMVSRSQLEESAKGIYGQGIDAGAYLGKFVQFWLRLPKTRSLESLSQDHNQIYCRELAGRFGLNKLQGHRGFQEAFAALASLSGLSLRDLERGYTLFSIAQPLDNASSFAAWVIWLKLTEPDVFAGVLSGEPDANREAARLATELNKRTDRLYILSIVAELHTHVAGGGKTALSQDVSGTLGSLGTWGLRPERFMPWLCEKVDLSVET